MVGNPQSLHIKAINLHTNKNPISSIPYSPNLKLAYNSRRNKRRQSRQVFWKIGNNSRHMNELKDDWLNSTELDSVSQTKTNSPKIEVEEK